MEQYLDSLPYYPYSLYGGVAALLFVLILLPVLYGRSSKKRKPVYANKPPMSVRSFAVDGLPFEEGFRGGGDSRPGSAAPAAPPLPAADSAIMEAAVKSCQEAFQEIYIEMYIGLGLMSDFESLRGEVNQRLADARETYHAVSALNMTAEAVVLTQMASVAGNILQSGGQHIGKGLLGIHGQELFSVYRYAVNTMQGKGFATREETQNKLDFMDRRIQELG